LYYLQRLLSPFDINMPSSSMIIDSTIPNHIFKDITIFNPNTYNKTPQKKYTTAFGQRFKIKGTGTVFIKVRGTDGVWQREMILRECWHVEAAHKNSYSSIYSTSKGWEVMLNPHDSYIRLVENNQHSQPSRVVQNNQRNQPSRVVGNNQRTLWQPPSSRVVQNNQRNKPPGVVQNNQRNQPSSPRVVQVENNQRRGNQTSVFSEIPLVRKADGKHYLDFTYIPTSTPDRGCLIQ